MAGACHQVEGKAACLVPEHSGLKAALQQLEADMAMPLAGLAVVEEVRNLSVVMEHNCLRPVLEHTGLVHQFEVVPPWEMQLVAAPAEVPLVVEEALISPLERTDLEGDQE